MQSADVLAGLVEQLALHGLEVLAVHDHRRGGEHLARGDRPDCGLDAGRGVLHGQQDVVADRVGDVRVQAADLLGVLTG